MSLRSNLALGFHYRIRLISDQAKNELCYTATELLRLTNADGCDLTPLLASPLFEWLLVIQVRAFTSIIERFINLIKR